MAKSTAEDHEEEKKDMEYGKEKEKQREGVKATKKRQVGKDTQMRKQDNTKIYSSTSSNLHCRGWKINFMLWRANY